MELATYFPIATVFQLINRVRNFDVIILCSYYEKKMGNNEH
jgi:hypothetical protein